MAYVGEIVSIGTALCWTITVISFEYAGKKVGSLAVNFIRLIIGFVLLGFTILILNGAFIPLDATGEAWSYLMISGFIGLVIGDLFLFQAFVDVGGRISLLIMSMVPVMSTILGIIFLEEFLETNEIIGMVITLSAIALVIILKKQKDVVMHPNTKRGIIFAFIGAIAQSVGLIFSKIGMQDYSAFGATQIRVIAAIIGFSLYIMFKREWKNVGKAVFHKKAMIFIAIGSVFGPFLGVSSSLYAMQHTQIGIATTIAQLNVILIIPFSILLFKEKVSYKEILASVIAFAGVAIIFL